MLYVEIAIGTATTTQEQGSTILRWLLPLGVLLGLMLAGCDTDEPPDEGNEQRVPVTVASANVVSVDVYQDYAGRVHGAREVNVRARVDGILEQRLYREGQLVETGDILFRIDPGPLKSRLEEAEAQLLSARADLTAAEREWSRVSRLHEQNSISAREYDSARKTLALAQAASAMAEARKRKASLKMEYTRVQAPVPGVTNMEAVPEGTLLERGALLTTIVQHDPAHVRFALPEDDAVIQRAARRAMHEGEGEAHRREATLLLPGGSEHDTRGEIDFTASSIDSRTGTVLSRAVFDNPDGALIPGQFVRIRLVLEALEDVFKVPETVISDGAEGPQLFVINGEDEAELRQVRLGPVVDGAQIILDGLEPDDRVVVNGHAGLVPGMPVEITEPDEDTS